MKGYQVSLNNLSIYREIANPVPTETIADTKMINEIYNAIMI